MIKLLKLLYIMDSTPLIIVNKILKLNKRIDSF